MPSFDPTTLCGWVDDPKEVDRVLGMLPHPLFGPAAICAREEPAATEVFFWEVEEKIFGKTLPAHLQTIGDCVSHGNGRAAQDLWFYQLLPLIPSLGIDKVRELALQIATEPTYAFSRVEVGNGRLGLRDGSVGAWAAKGATDYGHLFRKQYGSVDLSRYSGERAKAWGMPRAGVPDELEPTARRFIVRTASLVTDGEDFKRALLNWYPGAICSQQGFTKTRDKYGFCRPSGTWPHCMEARGCAEVLNGTTYDWSIPIQQSWGNSPNGPNRITCKSGREVELPEGVFMVPLDDVDRRMLRAKDTFVFSEMQGGPDDEPFPTRPDFTIL